jgi:pyruvate dehydrogenase E2 component (dihydrolipoamide acetyltransferase)
MTMAITIDPIEIPKWGLTMRTATVVSWHLREGDRFKAGDHLATIESTKVAGELEAPFSGTLRRIVAAPGTTLPVGALIGASAAPEVSDAEIDAYISAHATAPVQAAAARPPANARLPAGTAGAAPGAPEATARTVVPDSLRGSFDAPAVNATPAVIRYATGLGLDLSKITGTGRLGRISTHDVDAAIEAAGGTVAAAEARRPQGAPERVQAVAERAVADDADVPATSIARRLARQLGVNLRDCQRTGPGGRVSKSDVEEAAGHRQGASPAAAAPTDAGQAQPGPGEYQDIPLTQIQRVIAERLGASMLVPHFRVSVKIVLDALLEIRTQVNATVPDVHLSVTDFLVKAAALALVAVPEMNAELDEDAQAVRRFADADVSVAVETDQGLITPIIRRANAKPLRQLSAEFEQLTKRAKAGTLQPDEFQGGTFTVSNLGMYGITQFDAIINPPQGAILAVAALAREQVDAGDHFEPRHVLNVTLTCDHRFIDGVLAASFLRQLKTITEQPYLLLV